MAAVQKGASYAGVWGIPGTLVVTATTKTHEIIRTYNYSKESDSKEIRNAVGDVVNITYYNARERLTVDIIVTSTTLALAVTDFCNLPGVGDEVTIANAGTNPDTQITSTTGTEWIVESASKVATQDDHGTMSLTLARYTNDLNTISA